MLTIAYAAIEDIGLNHLIEQIDSPSGNRANREDGTPYQLSLLNPFQRMSLISLRLRSLLILTSKFNSFFGIETELGRTTLYRDGSLKESMQILS